MKVSISSDALDDIMEFNLFNLLLDPNLGGYILSQLLSDIEGLKITAVFHKNLHKNVRRALIWKPPTEMLLKIRPYSIFYEYKENQLLIIAVVQH